VNHLHLVLLKHFAYILFVGTFVAEEVNYLPVVEKWVYGFVAVLAFRIFTFFNFGIPHILN